MELGGGEVQVGSWMSLGLWKISDWIKYHRVVKINQVSDLRLEAAQGNKIDFTGFVQNVELCYKKVDIYSKDGVFSLLRFVFLSALISWTGNSMIYKSTSRAPDP